MFENIDYIYCVYKEKSFSKAAEKLFISQPSLSLTIKKAEQILGTPVFDRSKSPIQLTEFGKKYIQAIEQIFDLEEQLSSYLNELAQLKHGRLSVGAGNFCLAYILPKIIERYRTAYPDIQFNIQEVGAAHAAHLLDSGAVDLVIANCKLDSRSYIRHPLYQENLVLAIPKKYAVNDDFKNVRLSLADLLNRKNRLPETPAVALDQFPLPPLIVLKKGNSTRTHMEAIFRDFGVEPQILLELDQSITTYQTANYGMGGTLISDLLVRCVQNDDNLWFYKIDHPDVVRTTNIYHCKSRYLPHSAAKFVEMACEELATE